MANKGDEYKSMFEVFVGNSNEYEHIRADRQFYDLYKAKIIRDDKLRKSLERREGQRFYKNWKELTRSLAEDELRRRGHR